MAEGTLVVTLSNQLPDAPPVTPIDALVYIAGWHVPTLTEVQLLVANTGGDVLAGEALKAVGTVYWSPANSGTDLYGFAWLGTGYRDAFTGAFAGILDEGDLWTATEHSPTEANEIWVQSASGAIFYSESDKKYGLSVRLIKDDSTNPGTVTDYDGNVYPTVKIGTQVWMAINLATTHYSDGTPIPIVTDAAEWAALTTAGMCYYNNTP